MLSHKDPQNEQIAWRFLSDLSFSPDRIHRWRENNHTMGFKGELNHHQVYLSARLFLAFESCSVAVPI